MNHQKYNNEFKTHAVEMVLKEGLTRTEVGRRLETSSKNISRWVREYQDNEKGLNLGQGGEHPLKKRIQSLEKENQRLKMEHDILKNSLLGQPSPI